MYYIWTTSFQLHTWFRHSYMGELIMQFCHTSYVKTWDVEIICFIDVMSMAAILIQGQLLTIYELYESKLTPCSGTTWDILMCDCLSCMNNWSLGCLPQRWGIHLFHGRYSHQVAAMGHRQNSWSLVQARIVTIRSHETHSELFQLYFYCTVFSFPWTNPQVFGLE